MRLSDIDLKLPPGNLYVLFGLSRAGKPSPMRLMARLDRPTSGQLRVDGKDLSDATMRQRSLALVDQQVIHDSAVTVFDHIASPMPIKGLAKAEIERTLFGGTAQLPIDHRLDRPPSGRAVRSSGSRLRAGLGSSPPAARRVAGQARWPAARGAAQQAQGDLSAHSVDRGRRHHRTERAAAARRPCRTKTRCCGPAELFQRPAAVQGTQTFSEPAMNLTEGVVANGRCRRGHSIEGPRTGDLERLPFGRSGGVPITCSWRAMRATT